MAEYPGKFQKLFPHHYKQKLVTLFLFFIGLRNF